MNVGALNDEDSASDLENISYSERVESALLSFCAKSQPRAVRGSNIRQVEPGALLRLRLARRGNCLLIADLCVVVAHLRVFLNAERILLITSDSKP